MGLGDFLADAGDRTAVGQIAQAFGGRTSTQRGMDSFISNELPALTDQIHKAGTKEEIIKGAQAFIAAGLKARIRPDQLDKLMGMVVQPALQNLQKSEIDKIRSDYGQQPAQPRPEGVEGPMTESGNFIDPRAAKPLDQEGMLRLGQAVGANPQGYNQLLRTPGQIEATTAQTGQREADTRKTEQALMAEKAKQEAIEGLPNEPAGPNQPPMRAVARINPAGITSFLPGREMSESAQQLAQDRMKIAEERMRQSGDNAAERINLARERLDITKQNQEQRGADSETTADQPYGSIDREIDLKMIAKEAMAQGKTKPDDIKAIAARRGLVIEGTPEITGGKRFGFLGEEPSLAGNFEIKRKPMVTTRTRAGTTQPAGQGRYSEGVPTGSAPTSKAKRLKFDAKGNQVE